MSVYSCGTSLTCILGQPSCKCSIHFYSDILRETRLGHSSLVGIVIGWLIVRKRPFLPSDIGK